MMTRTLWTDRAIAILKQHWTGERGCARATMAALEAEGIMMTLYQVIDGWGRFRKTLRAPVEGPRRADRRPYPGGFSMLGGTVRS